jgi:hypothetical protein
MICLTHLFVNMTSEYKINSLFETLYWSVIIWPAGGANFFHSQIVSVLTVTGGVFSGATTAAQETNSLSLAI